MSVLFRPQRGSLADAMAEVVEVTSKAALLAHLQRDRGDRWTWTPTEIVSIEPYPRADGEPIYDERIGWRTYIVVCLWPDGTEQPAGFTNGPLP